jgi:hypothetical protein
VMTTKKQLIRGKKTVQEAFKNTLGLIIDQPKQDFGTSNDGNTARRFFKNSQMSSLITAIDLDLITRLHIILQAISSGFETNIEAFKEYCLATARKYVTLYEWYPMPTTLHKILIHGAVIADALELPIGQLSEETQEASNKNIKNYRRNFDENVAELKIYMMFSRDLWLHPIHI